MIKKNKYQKLRIKALLERKIRQFILFDIKENCKICFFSINKIEINNDHSIAKIYISFFKKNNNDNYINEINKLAPKIRQQLAKEVSLFRIPKIIFFLDDRFLINEKINDILLKNNKNNIN